MQRTAMHECLPVGAITWQQEEGCITVDHKRCLAVAPVRRRARG